MLGFVSDVGNVRTLNEDYYGYLQDKDYSIYVIADGMGGHNAGEVASKIAVEETINVFKKTRSITEAIRKANEKIYLLSVEDKKLSGMGTTITVAVIENNNIEIGHVGDSSCFVIDGDEIVKITRDHSLVQELIEIGSITEEQAKTHPNRNIITRALGTNDTIDIDVYKLELTGKEKFILCTDGLSNYIEQDEMLAIVNKEDCKKACLDMVELAKSRGGRDNITVIVFEGEGREC
ncbi:Stp1/IreP family PP2C-type Ser/Thr phosphatase [Clostridium bornimense]|uniref:Stp1/IreP family PP2C-type Ser/Thr phosphatase n=1 Tax=Clostridium bornimense TaxID=1216932 RepID=UPI001C11B1BE|nr:Stp1/IreP family PP2C-type Ser/Thr phosphatase [Clostridium bornimense]MBU5316301.1 Stp1/IreP family PP2C-type Ser/Thr phosphatase [Clostridium bornimense]